MGFCSSSFSLCCVSFNLTLMSEKDRTEKIDSSGNHPTPCRSRLPPSCESTRSPSVVLLLLFSSDYFRLSAFPQGQISLLAWINKPGWVIWVSSLSSRQVI